MKLQGEPSSGASRETVSPVRTREATSWSETGPTEEDSRTVNNLTALHERVSQFAGSS